MCIITSYNDEKFSFFKCRTYFSSFYSWKKRYFKPLLMRQVRRRATSGSKIISCMYIYSQDLGWGPPLGTCTFLCCSRLTIKSCITQFLPQAPVNLCACQGWVCASLCACVCSMMSVYALCVTFLLNKTAVHLKWNVKEKGVNFSGLVGCRQSCTLSCNMRIFNSRYIWQRINYPCIYAICKWSDNL